MLDRVFLVQDHECKLGDHGGVVRDLGREVSEHAIAITELRRALADYATVIVGHVTWLGTSSDELLAVISWSWIR